LCDSEGWLLSNPMGIRTEREIHAEFEGAKIYRRLYEKKHTWMICQAWVQSCPFQTFYCVWWCVRAF